MGSTPLHHKPIFYGSPLLDLAFWVLVVLHILPAAIAPVSAIVSLAAKKGGRMHLRAGKLFVRSMVATAVTGIVIDVIRLSFFVPENHTKYAGFSMPSTMPARLGFLFAGFCVLYLAREATPPRVFRASTGSERSFVRLVPALLLIGGAALTILVVLRFNPWTGALWMIWTFSAIVVVAARASRGTDRRDGVARHRFGMTFLAAFSWWGALQGFGPAIAIAIKGADPSTTPYRGDQPGPYGPIFWFFLVGWAPLFIAGVFIVRAFARRRDALGLEPKEG
jgi:hypothetical protein